MNTTSNKRLDKTLSNMKGRFFGLVTKQGETINAQLASCSNEYITVLDRNAGVHRKFSKASIGSLSVGGKTLRFK
tara:strand:- start:13922 stop:14146 length:225 start_codon:yes stop_codon:yes gene_type:complete